MKGVLAKILLWSVVLALLVFVGMSTVDKMYEADKEQTNLQEGVIREMQALGTRNNTGNILVDSEIQQYIEDYLGGNVLTAISKKHNIYEKLRRNEADDIEKMSRFLDEGEVYLSDLTKDIRKLDEVVEKTEYLYKEIEKAEVRGYAVREKDITHAILLGTLLSSLILTGGYMLSSAMKGYLKKKED